MDLSEKQQNTLRTLADVAKLCHSYDDKQLLLFIGIFLNDTDIVKQAIELEVDVYCSISERNHQILQQFGCTFPNDRLNSPTTVATKNINDS